MASPHSRRRRGALTRLPAIGVVLFAMVVSLLAILHRGVETAEVEVDDGGIWVTNESKQLVGHLNYDARVLDGALRTETADFDIGQAGETVTLSDFTSRSVAPVDVAAVSLGAATSLPEDAVAVQGGPTLGVLDPLEGALWAAPASSPAQTPFTADAALAKGLDDGAITASTNGRVFALSPRAGLLVEVRSTDAVRETREERVDGLAASARVALTAVGDRPVGLDAETNSLILPDGTLRPLSDEGIAPGGVLQLPGPDADAVLLATPTALVSIPLDGSEATLVPVDGVGRPAAPVRHRGCAYAAWSGTGAYLRACEDETRSESRTVDALASAGGIVFRTNRTRIVLNDIGTGSVWLPDENMVLMDDWDEIEKQLTEKENLEDSPEITDEIADPERNEKNTPPDAVDDEFGVRPGRSTTLPVLQNDSDADGDVLTARPLTEPAFGTIARTRGGRALQITGLADDATGSTSFDYEASDGRALDTATVRVSVHPWSVNGAPKQLRDPSLTIGAGAEIEYNALVDWIDPDGDQIFLAGAEASDGLAVRFSEDGTLAITELGAGPGPKSIRLRVSDGEEVGEGVLTVNVQDAGNIAPVANADFYVARVGEPLVLDPLTNDTDANGDSLALVAVSVAPPGAAIAPDLALGTISFTGSAPGSYQFTYTTTDGPSTALGVVRVDVVPLEEKATPVAEDDLAVLPAGGSVLVAPLGNDSDPAGGVLVVQTIDVPANSGLEVTLIDRHLLRIAAPAGLDRSVAFSYTVSNGQATATAEVTVVPAPAANYQLPPEPTADSTKVRVGDVGSINVLANDRSPSGLTLAVLPSLEYTPNDEVGRPFVTGNLVRLEAGTTPGVLRVAYTVRDSAGNTASAVATFEVVAESGANSAPKPKPLTAWAVTGQTARIPVPLNGIDPDGDSVALVGIEQSPAKGTVALGTEWLEYTPADGASGTDVFTYIVEDRKGKQASGRVRVGIAPPATYNQNPTALPDTVLVRPDRQLAVSVLANDVDADGDTLSLVPDSLQSVDDALAARVDKGAIALTTPSAEGSYAVSYAISDGRGGQGRGVLTVNVSADAPLQAPIARDDVVALSALSTEDGTVRVPVLDNDEDPDGPWSSLVVSTNAPGVRVEGRDLVVTPTETRALVVYTITDDDGLSSSAVVSVPGAERTYPALDDSRIPVKIRAGQDVVLDIADYVLVRTGRTPRILDETSIRASEGVDPGARLADGTRISFHASDDYSGKSSLSFTVSDGLADDDSALSSTLTIPLEIASTTNHPPILSPTPVRVAAGEEAVTQNLALMVSDPDGQDPEGFAYSLVDTPNGVAVSLDGRTLSVRAATDQPKGALAPIVVSVDDGSGPVRAEIPVEVVASTRPRIQVSDAVIGAANAGGVETIDLAGYTINPFPETPIRIVSASIQLGRGTVDPHGTVLTITPAADYHGDMTVTYRLMDATGDPDRMVEGRIVLVVRDRPDAPSDVRVEPSGAGRAFVSFTPGSDNGAPIIGYVLTDQSSGRTYDCAATSCPLTGLENGVQHAFTVVARNDVGESAPSAPSAAVLVDASPQQPAAPTIEAGSGTLLITWTAPSNEGSAITGYTLYVSSGAGTDALEVPGSQLSYELRGLTNGTTYSVAVAAHNRAEQPSPTSSTAQGTPHGRPAPPSGLAIGSITAEGDGSTASVQVVWTVGSSEGTGWGTATIDVGGARATAPSDAGSVTVPGVVPDERIPVSLTITNAEGDAESASTTTTVTTIPLPLAAPPRLTPTGVEGELLVSGLSERVGRGFNSRDLVLRWALAGGDCANGEEIRDGRALDVGSNAPVELAFCQTAYANGGAVASPVVTASGRAESAPPPPVITASVEGTSIVVTWAPIDASPAADSAVLAIGRERIDVDPAAGRHVYEGAIPGRTYPRIVLTASNARGSADSNVETASIPLPVVAELVDGECAADVPVLDPKQTPCRTYALRAPDWVDGSPTLRCVVGTDIDGTTRQLRISSADPVPALLQVKDRTPDEFAAIAPGLFSCRIP